MNSPKKSLGQHWLHDTNVLTQIVEIAEVEKGDNVLEVGPGLGTLTEFLLGYGAHVMAVEYDRELYENLSREAEDLYSDDAKRLEIVNQDILQFDLTTMPPGYKVVANIPYYLTSNLIRVLSETSNPPQSVTLLIQKEVAVRLCAKPGDMSLLSVTAQMYFEASLGPVVPGKLFTPPPKVDSQVVHLKRREKPLFDDMDSKLLFRVVKAGFSNRRKTLLNSLSGGLHLTKDQTKELLNKANIDPGKRPQELELQQWINLTSLL